MKRYFFPVLIGICLMIVVGYIVKLSAVPTEPDLAFVQIQTVSDSPTSTRYQATITGQPAKATSTVHPSTVVSDALPEKQSSCSGEACASVTSTFIHVPFSTQAPFSVWDAVHEETCEETAVMMVASYYQGETGVIPAKTADERILHIVDVEQELLGVFKDTDAKDTGAFAEKAYPQLHARVLPLASVDDIKQLLQKNIPVILPADGKKLKNPNFRNGGPPYHMLVIVGYADGYFITNDPGTRNGRAYRYKEDVLFTAAHDWNDGDVANGEKVMLIIKPAQ